MNLAAIDIGTNSIHMIIVKVTSRQTFEVLVQEKEMVKLGVGVFANKMLSEQAFNAGIETVSRYVQLADEYGVELIITLPHKRTSGKAFSFGRCPPHMPSAAHRSPVHGLGCAIAHQQFSHHSQGGDNWRSSSQR